MIALCGSGGDRLSRALRHSTMGAGVFNGRVRDGIGFWARRSSHQTGATQFCSDGAVRVLRRRVSGSASMQRRALRVFVWLCLAWSSSALQRLPITHGHGSRERSSQSGD